MNHTDYSLGQYDLPSMNGFPFDSIEETRAFAKEANVTSWNWATRPFHVVWRSVMGTSRNVSVHATQHEFGGQLTPTLPPPIDYGNQFSHDQQPRTLLTAINLLSHTINTNTTIPLWVYTSILKLALQSWYKYPMFIFNTTLTFCQTFPLTTRILGLIYFIRKASSYLPIYSPLREQQAIHAKQLQTFFRTFTYTNPTIPNTQYTTHPIAAGVRSHNRRTIIDFLNQSNLKIFELHSGYHKQLSCYQGIYAPADLNKTPTFEPVFLLGTDMSPDYLDMAAFHDADILLLSDADWYIDLPQLCSYGKALAILTKDTSQLCGQHGEIHFSPTLNNEFHYDVLGGGRYQHKSHKFDCDHFVTEYDNGLNDTTRQMVHTIDRFPLCGNDLFVTMTPLPNLPTKFPLSQIYQEMCYPMPNNDFLCLQLVYEKQNTVDNYTLYIAYPNSQYYFNIAWDTALALDNANLVSKLTTSCAASILIREGEQFYDKTKYIKDTIINHKDAILKNMIIASHRHTGPLTTVYDTKAGYKLDKPDNIDTRPHYKRDYFWNRIINAYRGSLSFIPNYVTTVILPRIRRFISSATTPPPTAHVPPPPLSLPHFGNRTRQSPPPPPPSHPILKTTKYQHPNTFNKDTFTATDFLDAYYNPTHMPIIPPAFLPTPPPSNNIQPSKDPNFQNKQKQLRETKIANDNYVATLDTSQHLHFEPDYGLGDDTKPIMHATFPLLTHPDNVTYAYTKGSNGSFDAIFQRIERVNMGINTIDPSLAPLLDTIRMIVFMKFYDNAVPLTIDELKLEVETANQIKRMRDYERERHHLSVKNFSSKNSSFVKAETASKHNAAQRNISNTNTDIFVEGSTYVAVAAKILKQRFPGYVFQHNAQTVGALINHLANTFKTVCETDYSKYDGTQNILTVYIEKLVFAAMFKDPTPMFDVINGCTTSTFNMNNGSSYKPNYTRLSGSPQTSFSNSIINAIISVTAYIYGKYKTPYTETIVPTQEDIEEGFSRIVVGGDDGLAFDIDPLRYDELVKLLGMKIDIAVKTTDKPLNMLALIYPCPKASPAAGVDIPRFFSKLSFGTISSPLLEIQQIYAKVLGYQITFGANNPQFTAILDKIYSLLPKSPQTTIDDTEKSYTYFMGQPEPIPPALLDTYYKHIDYKTKLMIDLLLECNDLEELIYKTSMLQATKKPLPQLGPGVADAAFEYLNPITADQRDTLGPQIANMIPKITTLDAIRVAIKMCPEVNICIDPTVGWGSMSNVFSNSRPDIPLSCYYYDVEEWKLMVKTGAHDFISTASLLPNDTVERAHDKQLLIIDLPFAIFNDGKGYGHIKQLLNRFQFQNDTDCFIINVPKLSAKHINKLLKVEYKAHKTTLFYQSNNSALLTNFTNTPVNHHMTPRYDLTKGKATPQKNLEMDLKINPSMPVTPAEGEMLDIPVSSNSTIIKRRSTAVSGKVQRSSKTPQ